MTESFKGIIDPSIKKSPSTNSVSEKKPPQAQSPSTNSVSEKKPPQAQTPNFEYDRYFLSWLRDNNVSLMCSSYKSQRIFSIGTAVDPTDKVLKLSLWMTFFNRPMGLIADKKTCWISSSGNMWRFENTGEFTDPRENVGKFDANYVIRQGYFSSDIDNHDICTDLDDNVYYCSAAFSCICTTSKDKSFKVFWRPPWITKTVPEDRCHLNGLCSRDGKPRYVTSVCQGNVKGAWRENRIRKGIIYDIVEDKVVCEGLTMPHSPRWYNDKLWVLDAGTGWFGYVENKKLVQKVWLPGYLRGMSFVNDRYVVIGTSEDRHENVFQGLPLGEELAKNGVIGKCGIHIIDMKDWSVPHNMIFKDTDTELYDVVAIQGMQRPRITDIGDNSNMLNYQVDYGDYPN